MIHEILTYQLRVSLLPIMRKFCVNSSIFSNYLKEKLRSAPIHNRNSRQGILWGAFYDSVTVNQID
jgi:hypothetical protein